MSLATLEACQESGVRSQEPAELTIKTLLERIEAELAAQQPTDERHPPTRVVTVRMPRRLHERLRETSRISGLSMNRLAVQALDYAEELVRREVIAELPVTERVNAIAGGPHAA